MTLLTITQKVFEATPSLLWGRHLPSRMTSCVWMPHGVSFLIRILGCSKQRQLLMLVKMCTEHWRNAPSPNANPPTGLCLSFLGASLWGCFLYSQPGPSCHPALETPSCSSTDMAALAQQGWKSLKFGQMRTPEPSIIKDGFHSLWAMQHQL